ncbi:uncharacterized protein LOC105216091 [Zeugodacus cucurbitae]|uniref:uncharacterized protein LOC105216091 n=1 Tax=Zeugodacus cucurbitae TaxID=28588 RepID=UPI0023D922A4|nr:uncharacterized protein LOC105216091 [Zeugodacus cucurbitae]
MKFLASICLAICLFVVACHGVPVERETLLSIEEAQPEAVVEEQPQQLRRVARGFIGGYVGYPGFVYGGYRSYPVYSGYRSYPVYGPVYGPRYSSHPVGGYGGSYATASASASSGSYFG